MLPVNQRLLNTNIHALVADRAMDQAEDALASYESIYGTDALAQALTSMPIHDLACMAREGDLSTPSMVHLLIGPGQFAELMVQELAYAESFEDARHVTASFSHVMTGILFRDDVRNDPERQIAFIHALMSHSHLGFAALVRYIKENFRPPDMDWEHPRAATLAWYTEYQKDFMEVDDCGGCAIMHRLLTYDEPTAMDILDTLERQTSSTGQSLELSDNAEPTAEALLVASTTSNVVPMDQALSTIKPPPTADRPASQDMF
jgi:hypothetical protein